MDQTWLDRAEYPFAPHFMDVEGGRMHYVDEGSGPVVVMVHGTPTWSFLYRKLIRELSRTHRVIAPDNIGFGLSDKPADWGYRPSDHARNLATLLERLEPGPFTLVVHDFGGPIGLSYAVEHPEQVERIVLFNTFLWSMADNRDAIRGRKLFGGAIGRFLYKRLNFSPRFLIPLTFADKRKLTPAIHRQYREAFPTPQERQGAWALVNEVIDSGEWYDSLWRRLDLITSKPALLLWGMKDPAFGPKALERWESKLKGAEIHRLEAGHFVQEEAPEYPQIVRRFLETTKASA